MRIFGLTVGRNETLRYLRPMLAHMVPMFDTHFFFDDQSEDDTANVAREAGCVVLRRPDGCPSFLEDEGLFREHAWHTFESVVQPTSDDFVLVVDCDEVLVSWTSSDPATVRQYIEHFSGFAPLDAFDLYIPEVFGFDEDGCPLVRMDRLWNTIHAPRLFRYRPGGSYSSGLGAPAVPHYVMMQMGKWGQPSQLSLMHYGYAQASDQAYKYGRYNGQGGHSNEHVQSIVAQDKELIRWDLPYVEEMRAAWTQ